MRVFLIHIRDPQFYALPAANRAKNGRIWVMCVFRSIPATDSGRFRPPIPV